MPRSRHNTGDIYFTISEKPIIKATNKSLMQGKDLAVKLVFRQN